MSKSVDIIRPLLRVFWLLPIQKKKVVITSYNGRRFSCNPKYVALGLEKTDAKVYYALRADANVELPAFIRRVKYRTLAHFYHLMTAKYIVLNSTGIAELLPYRRSQILINTWHGGGYFKTIGNDFFTGKDKLKNRDISGKNTSVFFASCEAFAKQLPKSMRVRPESVYRTGLPRNDMYFGDCSAIREKVFKKLKIEDEKKIVLYAPTYRDGDVKSINDSGFTQIDVDGVLKALEKRFHEPYTFVFKAHHDMIPDDLADNAINASDYDDIQELIAAADVFISDYSSCMWDYCLRYKPGFLYAPDIAEYRANHEFGTDPEDWPFEICRSNEELIQTILFYDAKRNENKITQYLEKMGSYEDGHSVEKLLIEVMKEICVEV